MAGKQKSKTGTKAAKPAAKVPAVRGHRPSKYDPVNHPRVARSLCLLGATNVQIAQALDISISTLDSWFNRFPEFYDAVQGGKLLADAKVADSLYRRATGYRHPATKIMQFQGVPVIVPFTERYAPDTTAAIFWLKNRQPGQWRDKIEMVHTDGSMADQLTRARARAKERAVKK